MEWCSVAGIVCGVFLGASSESYGQAYQLAVQTGQPIVVLVAADWCHACQVMEQTVVPQLRQRGILRKVAFAIVNFDREKQLAEQLVSNGPIPQVIMYRKTTNGWRRWKLVGVQPVEGLENFIEQGLSETEKAPDAGDTESPHQNAIQPHGEGNAKVSNPGLETSKNDRPSEG